MNERRVYRALSNTRLALVFVVIMLVGVSASQASLWYVDSALALNGNGQSWATAWNASANILWSSVQPGDTVYFSGGSSGSSKNYSTITVGKSGALNVPITISKGLDAGHNGSPTLNGGGYIELATSPIKSNIVIYGFTILNNFNTSTRTWANCINANNSRKVKVDSCVFSNINNCVNFTGAINFWVTNCTMLQVRGDAAVRGQIATGPNGPDWDQNIVENCYIEPCIGSSGGAPDGIQGGHGITSRYNTFRVKKDVSIFTSNQHPDYHQIPGLYDKVYGNDFQNIGDSCIDIAPFWANSVVQHKWIYNNIFRITEDQDPFPDYIRIYNNDGLILDISDVVIANNIFVDNPTRNNIRLAAYGPGTTGNPTGTGNYIINNIFYNSSGGGAINIKASTGYTATSWTINGNVYYGGGSVIYLGTTYSVAAWVAGFEPQGSTSQPLLASYTPKSLNNNFHLSGSDTVAVNTGIDMSAFFTIDRDKLTRPQGVAWDKGPYEFPAAGGSVLQIADASYTVAEDGGTVQVTFRRSGSITDSVGCSFATANGSATASINYTTKSGTLIWGPGDGTDKTELFTVLDTDMLETKTFMVTLSSPTGSAALGSQASTTINITGTGVPPEPLQSGYGPWMVTNAVVAAPFIIDGDYVYQTSQTLNPEDGGSLRFTFTNALGEFKFDTEVIADNGARNSFFANTNTTPVAEYDTWDVVQLTGATPEAREITKRGTGTFDTPEFSPWRFTLDAGTNTLIIRGREANTKIKSVTLIPINEEPPAPPPDPVAPTVVSVTTTMDTGYYKTNIVIPVTVNWSTNATVTGTPRILMNTGGYANYASGSGTAALLFNYVIGPGENTQYLDYDTTTALTLNGGTIRNLTTDAVLTLPAPGASGSLLQSQIMVVDTTKPTISFGGLVVTTNINWQVTYSDVNLLGNNLNTTNLTLVTITGDATGVPTVIGGGLGDAGIFISNLTGNGSVRVDVDAGTAIDLAGNIADAYSTPIVEWQSIINIHIRSGTFRSVILGRP